MSVIVRSADPRVRAAVVFPSPIKSILSSVATPPSIKAFKAQELAPGVYSISITGPVEQVVPAVFAVIVTLASLESSVLATAVDDAATS